ncbi:MAG: biopolymer transporter ExbD [Proteobacteria bacterium]|nr:biopolymer transporter ExbD [Pseudomonadota bacterium]MBU1737658.1 biopolymer transporter ExbD [Pseudomonadota bacterium]
MLRFPRKEQTASVIPLTALIDIVFLLLIYFLLTSNFIEQDSMDIKLPRVETPGILHQENLVVMIDRKGDYYIDSKKIPDRDLAETLEIWLRYSKTGSVLVKADRRVVYDRVIHLMDLAKKQGATKLMLATEPK